MFNWFCAIPFCCHNPTEVTWLDCIDIADKALYTAKNAGRNAWIGITLKEPLPMECIVIDGLNLPIDIIKFESNLEALKVKTTWQNTQTY